MSNLANAHLQSDLDVAPLLLAAHILRTDNEALEAARDLAATAREHAARRDQQRKLPWSLIEQFTRSGLGQQGREAFFRGEGSQAHTEGFEGTLAQQAQEESGAGSGCDQDEEESEDLPHEGAQNTELPSAWARRWASSAASSRACGCWECTG